MLTRFAPDLWLVDGPVVTAAVGFHYPTRMAVLRLPKGIVLWSPVPWSAPLQAAISELGDLLAIIAPGEMHDLGLSCWHEACPQVPLWAAPGLAAKRPDLPLHTLGEEPLWDGLDLVVLRNRVANETVLFHLQSRTVLFTDVIQQLPQGWFKGLRGVVARLDAMTEPAPSVPRKFRLGFTDRKAARSTVRRILEWGPDRLVFAHGPPVDGGATEALRAAFRWLRL